MPPRRFARSSPHAAALAVTLALETAEVLEHTQWKTATELEAHLADTKLACGIMTNSLRRAAELITSFKQVAVDQTSDQRPPPGPEPASAP